MSETTNLGLTLLEEGQTGAEVVVNDALETIDFLHSVAITDMTVDEDPPVTPVAGDVYWIQSAAPTGDWADHSQELAMYTSNGWIFATLKVGLLAWDIAATELWIHTPVVPTTDPQWTKIWSPPA
jgi:hypothetical protein